MLASALDSLITFNPWVLSTKTALKEATRQFLEGGIRAWPVVDDNGRFAGVLGLCELARGVQSRNSDDYVGLCHDPTAVALTLDCDPLTALQILMRGQQSLVPILEGDRVIGTLAASDFLQEIALSKRSIACELVVDHLDRAISTIDCDEPLPSIDGSLPRPLIVVQGDLPLGVLTNEVIAAATIECCARRSIGGDTSWPNLGQLLHSAQILTPGRTLAEAADVMIRHQLDAVAVTNQSAQMLGLISENAILRKILAD